MKKILALIVVLAAVSLFLLSGCIGGGMKDCGSDNACFEAAMATCEKAKVRTTAADASLGGATVTTYGEVRGGTLDSCTVYMKVEEFTFGTGATAEEVMIAEMFNGKEMTCTGPVSETGMDADPTSDACTGSLADLMKTMQGM